MPDRQALRPSANGVAGVVHLHCGHARGDDDECLHYWTEDTTPLGGRRQKVLDREKVFGSLLGVLLQHMSFAT